MVLQNICIAALGLFVAGLAPAQGDTKATAQTVASPAVKPDDDIAVIDTNLGTIKFRFRPDLAPKTVEHWEALAKKGFYDGTKFHRVIPKFMIQGGDPNSKGTDRSIMGTGGSGKNVDAEFNNMSHIRGVVSMARSNDPNSADSQFFIVVAPATFLDHEYTGFGEVLEGMDVVDKIVNLKRDEQNNPLTENPAIVKSVKIVKAKDAGVVGKTPQTK